MSGAEPVDLENRDPNGLNAHLGVRLEIVTIETFEQFTNKFVNSRVIHFSTVRYCDHSLIF
jgi:hypothetical protein